MVIRTNLLLDCRDEYCALEESDIGIGDFGVVIDISDKMKTRIKTINNGYGTTYIPQWLDINSRFLWVKLEPVWMDFTTTQINWYDSDEITTQFKSKSECEAFILKEQDKREKSNVGESVTYEDYPE